MMVDTQVRPADVTKYPIIAAMLDTPRELYVPSASESVAYMDGPVTLGRGREMPEVRTLAKMLDALNVSRGDAVLIVAGNLGYSTAILAHMATSVVMVEEDAAMAAEAEATLTRQDIENAVVLERSLTEGAPKAGPYDVIVIEGGVETVPAALTDQLRDGGRIGAIFQTGQLGEVRIGLASGGGVAWRFAFNAGAPVLPGFGKSHEFTL